MLSSSQILDSSQLAVLLYINTIGLSVLVETIKSAAFYVSNSLKIVTEQKYSKDWVAHFKSDLKEGKESFMFINGTGLDIMLEQYHLDYNAKYLRGGFFYAMKRNGYH